MIASLFSRFSICPTNLIFPSSVRTREIVKTEPWKSGRLTLIVSAEAFGFTCEIIFPFIKKSFESLSEISSCMENKSSNEARSHDVCSGNCLKEIVCENTIGTLPAVCWPFALPAKKMHIIINRMMIRRFMGYVFGVAFSLCHCVECHLNALNIERQIFNNQHSIFNVQVLAKKLFLKRETSVNIALKLPSGKQY